MPGIWNSPKAKELRNQFTQKSLNPTCSGCDMYRNLDLYRTKEGRERARINNQRSNGEIVKRKAAKGPWQGG